MGLAYFTMYTFIFPAPHVGLVYGLIYHGFVAIADLLTFDAYCCQMGTAIKQHVPDRVRPSFVIFNIRTL